MSVRNGRSGSVVLAAVLCLAAAMTRVGSMQAVSEDAFVSSTVMPAAERAVLSKYCFGCHNDRVKAGGLTLDSLERADISLHAETWEKVIRKLRTGLMPPAGRPRPDQAATSRLIAVLETTIDRAAAAAPNPGHPTVHRLNRAEYVNAIRDLVDLEIDGKALLPADDSGYGFDNIADVLSISPGLLERYVTVAQKVGRLAVGDPDIRPVSERYKFQITRLQDRRMSDDLPAGSRGGVAIRHYFPADGNYTLRISVHKNRNGVIHGLGDVNLIDVRIDGMEVKTFALGGVKNGSRYPTDGRETEPGQAETDNGLVLHLPVKAGMRVVGITFPQENWAPEGVGPSRLPVASGSFGRAIDTSVENGRTEMSIDTVHIEGPFGADSTVETPSRRRIFVCRPSGIADEAQCAKTILTTLARRAYRRPVGEADLAPLLGLYGRGRANGTFDSGVRRALEGVLVNPDFLFRIEAPPATTAPGGLFRISDIDLASRLSFFLWSTIPDDTLLDLATRGRLRDPVVLQQQVERMLRDARAQALVENFFGQWLSVRSLRAMAPDPIVFPEFDDNLREAFIRETELFLASQLREDRGVAELLTADYTFVNERLARHYGLPHIYGSHFRRVTLTDGRRAGLLGHGSVLTVTSYAHRTSPVQRGKWVLNSLLGAPPPPPPPDVPPLEEHEGKQPASMRERMEQHRKNPVCASCHARMDPLGFAFENFDGIGKWRTADAGRPVDPSGTFPNGHGFDSPAAFRAGLQQYREEFVTALAEKLLTYALGRGVEYYDMPAVRTILRESAPGDYRWSSLILNIVKSLPFQRKRVES